jgi:hypothetical protein
MGAIAAFFASPLGKIVLTLLVSLLEKSGLGTWAERLAMKFGGKVIEVGAAAIDALGGIKTYPEYPGDPVQTPMEKLVAESKTKNNLNQSNGI